MNTKVQNTRQACNGLTFDVMVAGDVASEITIAGSRRNDAEDDADVTDDADDQPSIGGPCSNSRGSSGVQTAVSNLLQVSLTG